jgi:phenylacetate-CoA ligase
MSETISAAERTAIGDAFGVPVTDLFVSTEGLVGHSEPGGTVLTFASDTCIAECTDDDGRPVPDGVASSKVLVTNLHNLTQPIIRYELTDRFTPAGSSDGGCLRASVQGRSDDLFRYPQASVHPYVIGATLLRHPAVDRCSWGDCGTRPGASRACGCCCPDRCARRPPCCWPPA